MMSPGLSVENPLFIRRSMESERDFRGVPLRHGVWQKRTLRPIFGGHNEWLVCAIHMDEFNVVVSSRAMIKNVVVFFGSARRRLTRSKTANNDNATDKTGWLRARHKRKPLRTTGVLILRAEPTPLCA